MYGNRGIHIKCHPFTQTCENIRCAMRQQCGIGQSPHIIRKGTPEISKEKIWTWARGNPFPIPFGSSHFVSLRLYSRLVMGGTCVRNSRIVCENHIGRIDKIESGNKSVQKRPLRAAAQIAQLYENGVIKNDTIIGQCVINLSKHAPRR